MIFFPPLDRRRLRRCRDAACLWSAADGAHIVVAAAGPSLVKSAATLKRADLVVAALRAAPILQSAGRTPDLVVAAGYRGYFAPPHLPRAPYLIDLRTHPAVADVLAGPLLLAHTDWDRSLGLPGPSVCAASSALAALDTAALMGASSISLVGWDVLSVAAGTPGRDTHRRGIGRFRSRFPNIIIWRDARYRITNRRRIHRLRRTIQHAPRSVSWITRLHGLAHRPDLWKPFWGPDYGQLKLGRLRSKLQANLKREKDLVTSILRSRGFA